MNIITGYTGTPHITSAQDRAINQGAYGTGSYIMNVGQKLAAEAVSGNEIRIRDGILCHQGCAASIEQGTYDSLEIANGSQGMNRIDLIVARYTKNAETNVEAITLAVIQGTATSGTPSAPAYNDGDIQAGDSPVDMPLYEVHLTGVNISSITQVADNVQTLIEAQEELAEHQDTLDDHQDTLDEHTSQISTLNGKTAWTEIASSNVIYCKIGSIVIVSSKVQTAGVELPTSAYTTIGTLPSGYRPSRIVSSISHHQSNGSVNGVARVNTNGTVQVTPSTTVSAAQSYCFFMIAYYV